MDEQGRNLKLVYLLPSLNSEKSQFKLWWGMEDEIKRILRAEVRLYGLRSVFWHILLDFLLSIVLFVTALKMNTDSFYFPSLRVLELVKLWDFLFHFELFFLTLKLIVLKKK